MEIDRHDAGGDDAGPEPDGGPDAEPTVLLDGDQLTDADGFSLYVFARAVPGDVAESNCAGECAATWPAFAPAELVLDESLDASLFGETGEGQVTFRGWPLYRFANDLAPGERSGDAVGGVWYRARDPFYSLLVRVDDARGRYAVDGDGNTLYYFARDLPSGRFGGLEATSACEGGCLAAWPLPNAADPLVLPSDFGPDAWTFFERPEGAQLLYRGWPVYAFAGDEAPAEAAGAGSGDVWFVHSVGFFQLVVMSAGEGGPYVATAAGRSVYLNRSDVPAAGDDPPSSTCLGGCLATWPPVLLEDPRAPSLLASQEAFGTWTREGIGTQLTFRGLPMYHFSGDAAAGERNGDGVGPWELVRATESAARASNGY